NASQQVSGAVFYANTNNELNLRSDPGSYQVGKGPALTGYAAPGTMFYDGGLFAVAAPSLRNTFVFEAAHVFGGVTYIPNRATSFTWTAQFFGMGATDSDGVDIYGPPTVGSNFSDYWENQGSGWALKTNSFSSAMTFAPQFTANVPEPSTMALSILGGIGL